MKKIFILLLFTFLSSCHFASHQVGIIKIKGSDTMFLLMEDLAENYMKNNPGISIRVEGGGSGTGFKALGEGKIDICSASRQIEPDEAKKLAEKYGAIGISFIIAKDALSIYVNHNNPVKNLTTDQLEKIFTCSITNWKEVGGEDEKIIPVIRPPNSGTHYYFKQHILNGAEYCESAIVRPTTLSVIDYVEDNKNAIGYGGIGYLEDIVHAKVNGIEAIETNVINDKYPISRYLYLYTINTPDGIVKQFIDWILSTEGQKVIKNAGYIPLWNIEF